MSLRSEAGSLPVVFFGGFAETLPGGAAGAEISHAGAVGATQDEYVRVALIQSVTLGQPRGRSFHCSSFPENLPIKTIPQLASQVQSNIVYHHD